MHATSAWTRWRIVSAPWTPGSGTGPAPNGRATSSAASSGHTRTRSTPAAGILRARRASWSGSGDPSSACSSRACTRPGPSGTRTSRSWASTTCRTRSWSARSGSRSSRRTPSATRSTRSGTRSLSPSKRAAGTPRCASPSGTRTNLPRRATAWAQHRWTCGPRASRAAAGTGSRSRCSPATTSRRRASSSSRSTLPTPYPRLTGRLRSPPANEALPLQGGPYTPVSTMRLRAVHVLS
mmetsp:Transcript_50506/g.156292  ORF Transcript_50506/g.156292 Transcript_50506/m.156292 type:complete len:238 (+) Transcript_50506:1475-2188(+)